MVDMLDFDVVAGYDFVACLDFETGMDFVWSIIIKKKHLLFHHLLNELK